MKKDTVIFDLDGTLSNSDHRVEFAQAKQWDAFHEAAANDPAHADIVTLALTLATDYYFIICTGRPEKYRAMTVEWLSKQNLWPDVLLMRPEYDFTKDINMKRALLEKEFGSLETALAQTVAIFEDRDRLVEGFRNLGFTCMQVRNGSY